MYYTLYIVHVIYTILYIILFDIIMSSQKLKLEGTAETGVPANDAIA